MTTVCRLVHRELGPFVDGELQGPRRQLVALHLERCTECASRVEDMLSIGDALRLAAERSALVPSLDGLASRVIGRDRAESAASWQSWALQLTDDWHWVGVGCGAVAATVVSVLLASMILAFGPLPEREDSLSALLDNLGSPAGMLFVYASPAGSGQDAVLMQVENGQPAASRMTAALMAPAAPSQKEADLVDALESVMVQNGGRVATLVSLRPAERRRAEELLAEIRKLRETSFRPGGRSVDVREVRMFVGVNAKRL